MTKGIRLTETPNELEYVSLDDRILTLAGGLPLFSFKDVRKLIPVAEIPDNTLYKAIVRLAKQKRIRYVRTANRMKVYTCIGTSNLPVIVSKKGDHLPISEILKNIDQFYTNGLNSNAKAINEWPIMLANLFIAAQGDTPQERLMAMRTCINQFAELQSLLLVLLDYCQSVLKHPALASEPNFTKTFTNDKDPEVPTLEQIIEYKKWLREFRRDK